MTLFKKIKAGATILTPNRRLSATLHKIYQAYQLEEQQTIWTTAHLLPLYSWLQQLFIEHKSKTFTPTPLLLSTSQEQYLWEAILQQTQERTPLLQVSETAKQIQATYSLLKQWQIDLHHSAYPHTAESIVLQQWMDEYLKLTHMRNWLDSATLPDYITEKINIGDIQIPHELILVGFTELSPQLKKLLTQCEKVGTRIDMAQLAEKKADSSRISFANQEKEIWTMAHFAKTISAKEPKATIGCVIPSLDKMRDRVQQIFLAVFNTNDAFNMTAGKPLAHYPLIHTALKLLSLYKKTIDRETFCYLLTSPFVGKAESEYLKRNMLDRILREKNITRFDLTSSFAIMEKYTPLLLKHFKHFYAKVDEYRAMATYQEWSGYFTELLTQLGWPGERSLNSEEYQIVKRFLDLLQELATLHQVATPVYFQQALHTLENMAKNSLFQAKTPDANVQVMGMLEAAGLPFDYLWIAEMDDLHFPPTPKPNPFIPKRLQRELNMPHATAQREFDFCEQLLSQFSQHVNRMIFSYAESEESLVLQPSPFIQSVPVITLSELALHEELTPTEQVYQCKIQEQLIDEKAPMLAPSEKLKGGINIIKQQAACPFKAFAEARLHADELEQPLPGWRAKDRGTYLHAIMDSIWNKLQTQSRLLALSQEQLNHLIIESIDTVFTDLSPSNYLMLEKKRLQQLINEWLELEKKRPPFTVAQQEKVTNITLNQLTLSMRIDRIDDIHDGKKLIIDYKTGKQNDIHRWFGDRPEEPQLPLYLLTDTDNTVGISFAQMTTSELGFKGVSQDHLNIEGIKKLVDWQQQLQDWYLVFTSLAEDFYQGVANVSPKYQTQTCLFCSLTPFCRIKEELT